MLSATYGTSAFDFSRLVQTWEFSCVPSFEWIELLNGKLASKYDLTSASDKFYSNIDLVMDFPSFQNFLPWYKSAKGQTVSLSSDLDIFFPDVYPPTSGTIVGYKDLGYLGDIFSQHRKVSLKLFTSQVPTYSSIISANVFPRGIWTQTYNYSDTFNVSQNGQFSEYTIFQNDSNTWTVDFKYLTRNEANNLLSWILTLRTGSANLTTNFLNSNSTTSRTSNYQIKSFAFTNNKTFYSATLNLVELANR